jgi:biopolymer transport protein ExbD
MSAGNVGGGGKRSANAELNLVPYIDLLSTLICFLLLTAVWSQIASLDTEGTPPGTESASSDPKPPEDKVPLSVSVLATEIEASAGPDKVHIPYIGASPDFKALLSTLQGWKRNWPDRKDVTLNTDSQVPYKSLIKVMDTLTEAEFADIGVNTQ